MFSVFLVLLLFTFTLIIQLILLIFPVLHFWQKFILSEVLVCGKSMDILISLVFNIWPEKLNDSVFSVKICNITLTLHQRHDHNVRELLLSDGGGVVVELNSSRNLR